MAKILNFALFFSFVTVYASAQPTPPKDVNILYKQLRASSADTGRVSILLNISRYYNAAQVNQPALPDSALATASRASQLTGRLSFNEGVGLSYQLMAQAWCKKKDFKKSDELIRKAIAVFVSHNLYRDAAEAYLNMQEFYLSAGGQDYKVMIRYYEQALPLFEKSGAILRAAATLNVLGDFYLQIDDFTHSIADLEKALAYYQSKGYRYLQSIYTLLGDDYRCRDNLHEALKYQLLAVKTAEAVKDSSMELCRIYNHTALVYYAITQVTQASYYFKKAIAVAEKYHSEDMIDLSSNLAHSLNAGNLPAEAIAVLKKSDKEFPQLTPEKRMSYDISYLVAYVKLKKYREGRPYCERLLKNYDASYNSPSEKSNALRALLMYNIGVGNYNKAAALIPVYKKAIGNVRLKNRVTYNSYLYSYQIDSARQNYLSAMQNYRIYVRLKDSVLTATINKQMQELQVQYDTEKKERENLYLRKESLLQASRIKQADHIRNLTLTGIVFLLIIVVLLYFGYRANRLNSKAISDQNVMLNKLVAEKEWLLKEIHHRVKNNLQIVMGLLQRQSSYIDNQDALIAIQNSENRMHSIALIHQKLYQSENLDLICMPEYVNEMIQHLKVSSNLDNRIFFEKQVDDIYLDVTQAVPLGLILNEAITNAIKYAYPADEAGIIYISLVKGKGPLIHLTIADNGPGLPEGFDIGKAESLGLNLMKGLSKQLGGSFDIANEDGCMINISFETDVFGRNIMETELSSAKRL
ncbi:hypothetical protein BEL04_11570 [Mucilaginibacter sp. PPCGB 2223]|uniref:histidine kinase dimerization/phosphoacceptor domain -containing protein n=1 Tax=Mucilaginibacter sp. PPCGB 2223 TaxID=1886027 RepID=UPI000824D3D9|nr:histidine kinase dimerization/phosphoacceptor domain -containing protein [Mucilaginibacter sp. PPCGB 2223]OCX52125.1 hypothetical protein BEL04_11570 [Mucilaginibacter sp. PPCGB 2223]